MISNLVAIISICRAWRGVCLLTVPSDRLLYELFIISINEPVRSVISNLVAIISICRAWRGVRLFAVPSHHRQAPHALCYQPGKCAKKL